MKIAIIGAGIFGVTIALKFSREGYDVILFEKENDIMTKVSTHNHFRHHHGYHYPRSKSTALECIKGRKTFEEEYGDCLLQYFPTFYSIVNKEEGTLTTPGQYLKFCEDLDLPYKIVPIPNFINSKRIALTVQVPERAFDPFRLKEICKEKLSESNVVLKLNSEMIESKISPEKKILKFNDKSKKQEYEEEFDIIINATYANMNNVKKILGVPRDKRQYELMELILVSIPGGLFGAMNMDGEYTSVIPVGPDGLYTIAHAKGSVVKRVISEDFDDKIESFGGFDSNMEQIMEVATNDFPILKDAKIIEPIYITKTVKANVDETDERPSEVFNHGNGIFSVFAGKIITCVDVANNLLNLVKNPHKFPNL